MQLVNLRCHNISNEVLSNTVEALGCDVSCVRGYVRAVLQQLNAEEWRFVIGRVVLSDKPEEEREDLYRDCAFICKALPTVSLLCLANSLQDEGLSLGPKLPVLLAEKDRPHLWTEELLPSSATAFARPVRRFTIPVKDGTSLFETQLLGFDLPYHKSAAAYAAEFMGIDLFQSHTDRYKGELLLDVVDERGIIRLEQNRLSISGNLKNLCLRGEINETPVSLKPGKTMAVELDDIRNIELWLLTVENEIIDFRSSSSFPHRFESEHEEVEYIEELKRVIESGESETCEFKSYIRVDNSKAAELPKTVCAFSNQRGGRLFIGVSDQGEVTGLAGELHRTFPGKDSYGDYIKTIEGMLREALNDNQCFHIERAELFGKTIIIILVEKSAQINYLHAGSQAYIRRGATDMKMTPPEILAHSPKNNLFG